MKLICYATDGFTIDIKPASSDRDWIDDTREKFANRCLPLVTANSHGWEILGQDSCEARWNGGDHTDDIEVKQESGTETYVISHFGHGILTFRVHCILRTEPGMNVWLTGPVNQFKDGIQPMSALMETDWMPYTFTMNWRFTRTNTWVKFEKGEPVCHFFPVPRSIVDDTEPSYRKVKNDPTLQQTYAQWRSSRDAFNKALGERDPAVTAQKWQKHYFRGLNPDGSPGTAGHQTKIRPRSFAVENDGED